MNADWLKYIAKHHNEWVNIVKSWGEHELAEDLVQEMYLKLYRYTTPEKIIEGDYVNKSYVWFALRSVFIAYVNEKNKYGRVSIDFDLEDVNTDNEKEFALNRLIDKIETLKESWSWYDAKLFDTYFYNSVSMRDLSDKTNISLMSIFNTIKVCKQKLMDEISEDIEDFLNGEYERI